MARLNPIEHTGIPFPVFSQWPVSLDPIPRGPAMLDIREEQLSPSFQKHHIHLGDEVYLVLHKFLEPDLGDPHDHPWDFTSMVAKGSYVEEIFQLDGTSERVLRKRGDIFHVPANRIHRVVELPDGECHTAATYGPKVMEFGFYQFREDGAYHRFWHDPEFTKL